MFCKGKKIMAAVLSCAMIATLGAGYIPAVSGDTVRAAVVGDEGSEGLTAVDKLTVKSPDGKVSVKIWKNDNGAYYYSAYLDDAVVIQCSELGLITSDEDLSEGMTLDEASVKVVDGKEDYDILQGPVNHVNKEWKELDFTLTKGNAAVTLNFRVSNDGMAYRYQVDADKTSNDEYVSVTGEDSSFVIPDTGTVWTNSQSNTYEGGNYTKRSISDVKKAAEVYSTPVLVSVGGDSNAWMLLTESSVYNNDDPYCSSIFQTKSGDKAIRMKYGNRLVGEDDMNNHKKTNWQKYEAIKNVEFTGSFQTPWRTAIIGKDLNAVTSSTLVSDLNPPAEGDFSWVEPGTSVWSWWSTSSDNIDYDSMFDYIDFCSNAGVKYCLVDYGWEIWDNYESKIKELCEYAEEKNVGLLLWYGVHKIDNTHIFDLDNEEDIEEQFAWCEKMGVKGVKVDYLNSDSQYAMKNMYWLADIAAKHHLVLNYHGCTDPNGENRTYPNILSSEAVCGMEYFKWFKASSIETLMTLPLTRNVIGSMEYTPALVSVPNSEATTGFMLSMCIQYESAIQTFAQSGYVYPGYAGFSLIADVPSTWDESKVLECYPGENLIRARRNGENWYVGAMTKKAGKYDVYLDFLDPDYTYNAYIYSDNSDGTDIKVTTRTVTANDVIELSLLENGGCSIKLTKDDPIKWTVYDNYSYYEAEDAVLSGAASVVDRKAYVSGQKFVQGLGSKADNAVTFDNVNVCEDGTYQLKIYVVSSSKKNLKVEVNGEEAIELRDLIGIAGDNDAVGDNGDYIDINLHAGNNTIKLYNDSGQAPSIDRIAVSKPLISNAEVKLDATSYTYDGKEHKPAVTVTRDGKTLTEGKEYELFYSNTVKPGTAKVYVTGANGYGGQIVKTYEIQSPATPAPQVTQTPAPQISQPTTTPLVTDTASVKKPAKVKISKVKAAKKSIKITFKKVSGAKGYQICYADNKKFKKAKVVNVKASVTTKTIKKLKSGKKYYVRVRAYNVSGKNKVWGSFSSVKSIKVK